jgi:hypothetical protein
MYSNPMMTPMLHKKGWAYLSPIVEMGRLSLYRLLSEQSTAMYGPSTIES